MRSAAPARRRAILCCVRGGLVCATFALAGCGGALGTTETGALSEADALDGSDADEFPPLPGRWYTVVAGDSVSAIAARFDVPIEDIEELNGLVDVARIEVGQALFLYGVEQLIAKRAAPAPKNRAPAKGGSGRIAWPVKAGRISSRFGYRAQFKRMHGGLDIAAPSGTPVYAAASGKVIYSDDGMRGYGNVVLIDHGGGVVTLYAHNSENLVDEGDRVVQGALIAKVGNTGHSTGAHLHFEVRIGGKTENPELHLPSRR